MIDLIIVGIIFFYVGYFVRYIAENEREIKKKGIKKKVKDGK